MFTNVIKIGNSKGIRIPKKVLDQCHIHDKVDLTVQKEGIVLRPIKKKPREGWDLAAKKMNEQGNDELLIPDSFCDDCDLDW